MFGKKVIDSVTLLVFLTGISPITLAGETPFTLRTSGTQSIEQPRLSNDPAQELRPFEASPADNLDLNPSGSSFTTSIESRRLRFEAAERRKLRFEAKDINHSLREIPGFEEYPGLPLWGLNYEYDCDPAFCGLGTSNILLPGGTW